MNNSTISDTPKIYVACLATYNNGYLHGVWIDAIQDINAIYDEINEMLAKSPIPNSEEWAIHDYKNFGDMQIHEYGSIESIASCAQFIFEHGELGAAILAYADGEVDEATRLLEDHYHGEYENEEDFAYQLAQDTMEIPTHLEFYIDYEKFARDLFMGDYFSIELNHQIHVFSY